MSKRIASALVLGSSVLALSAVIPACGSGGQTAEFQKPGSGNNPNGNGTGDDGSGNGPLGEGGVSPPPFGGGGPGNPPPDNPDASCASAKAQATREPVYMLFTVDGSGSMKQDNKWAAQVPALDSIFDKLLASNDGSLGVGLIGFSDSRDASCKSPIPGFPGTCAGPYPSSADVSIDVVDQAHHDALRGRIDGANASGGTPTLAALQGAYGELESFNPSQAPSGKLLPGGKKVVILMTDGVPEPGGKTEQDNCTQAAAAELQKGIITFAVGVGPFPSTDTNSYDPAFMGRLAQAGGTAPQGCDPASTDPTKVCHFQIDPKGKTADQIRDEFIAAIEAIRGQVSSCSFALNTKTGQIVDYTQVTVNVKDASGTHAIPKDPTNGWTYDNDKKPTSVILHGTACSSIQASANASIDIELGCVRQGPN